MELNISKFDPKSIERRRKSGSPPTIVVIGKRGTGKSTLVSDILYFSKRIPAGIVMSATEEGNAFYSKYIPDIFIHGEYSKEAISELILRQKRAIRTKKTKKKSQNDVFLLLDDCMYDRKMIRDKNIRGIFMNGRHWKIMLMITMQYCMDLPPDLRANIDFVFVMRENIIENLKKIYKCFFGIFPTFQAFQETMIACTEGYDCMVLDNTSRSNRIEDNIFWYRAKPDRKFKLGNPQIWKYHKKNYNKEHYLHELGASQVLKKTNDTGIIVKKRRKKKKKGKVSKTAPETTPEPTKKSKKAKNDFNK